MRHCLEIWNQGDNRITDLSKAYRLEPGTGWFVPAGVLHAPGSYCTYEPQWASDVFAMFQSLVSEVPIDWELLVKNVPEEKQHDLDYLVSLIDWEANTVPNFKARYFRPPVPVKPVEEMQDAGYVEKWISYGAEFFAAKELTVLPGRTVTIRDAGPYGLIMLQGHGTLGAWQIETPALIRFGQLTHDEYFVSVRGGPGRREDHQPQHDRPDRDAEALRPRRRRAASFEPPRRMLCRPMATVPTSSSSWWTTWATATSAPSTAGCPTRRRSTR